MLTIIKINRKITERRECVHVLNVWLWAQCVTTNNSQSFAPEHFAQYLKPHCFLGKQYWRQNNFCVRIHLRCSGFRRPECQDKHWLITGQEEPRLFHSFFAQPWRQAICLPSGLCKGLLVGFGKGFNSLRHASLQRIAALLQKQISPQCLSKIFSQKIQGVTPGVASHPTNSPAVTELGSCSSLVRSDFRQVWRSVGYKSQET